MSKHMNLKKTAEQNEAIDLLADFLGVKTQSAAIHSAVSQHIDLVGEIRDLKSEVQLLQEKHSKLLSGLREYRASELRFQELCEGADLSAPG